MSRMSSIVKMEVTLFFIQGGSKDAA